VNICRNISCHCHCDVTIDAHYDGAANINIKLSNDSGCVQTRVASYEAPFGLMHSLDVDDAQAPHHSAAVSVKVALDDRVDY
jgi:hypothetical protein